MELVLQCNHGKFWIEGDTGLFVSIRDTDETKDEDYDSMLYSKSSSSVYYDKYGGALAGRQIKMSGSIHLINDAIRNGHLRYLGDADWHGVDVVTITVSDNGNFGSQEVEGARGGKSVPLTHTRLLAINVIDIPDRPKIHLPTTTSSSSYLKKSLSSLSWHHEYPSILKNGYLTALEDTSGVIGYGCCNWTKKSSTSTDHPDDSIDSTGTNLGILSRTSIEIFDADYKQQTIRKQQNLQHGGRVLLPHTNSYPQSHYTRWLAHAHEGTWINTAHIDIDLGNKEVSDWLDIDITENEFLAPEVINVPIPAHLKSGEEFTVLVQPSATTNHNVPILFKFGDGAELRRLEELARNEAKNTPQYTVNHEFPEHALNLYNFRLSYGIQTLKDHNNVDVDDMIGEPLCCLLELTVPPSTPAREPRPNIIPVLIPKRKTSTSSTVNNNQNILMYVPIDGGSFHASLLEENTKNDETTDETNDEVGDISDASLLYSVELSAEHGMLSLTRFNDEGGGIHENPRIIKFDTFNESDQNSSNGDPFSLLSLLSFENGDGINDMKMSFSGNLFNINKVLSSLVYTPILNWNSDNGGGFDSISITVTELQSQLSSTNDLLIKVLPLNDAPVWSIQGESYHDELYTYDGLSPLVIGIPTFTLFEDVKYHFNEITVRDIDVSDSFGRHSSLVTADSSSLTSSTSDARKGFVEISIFVSNGTISIDENSPVTKLTQSSGFLTFQSTIDNVNIALSSLVYISHSNFNGPDSMILIIDDFGNTGYTSKSQCHESTKMSQEEGEEEKTTWISGTEVLKKCSLFDQIIIPLNILPVKDIPKIKLPNIDGIIETKEDEDFIITGLFVTDNDVLFKSIDYLNFINNEYQSNVISKEEQNFNNFTMNNEIRTTTTTSTPSASSTSMMECVDKFQGGLDEGSLASDLNAMFGPMVSCESLAVAGYCSYWFCNDQLPHHLGSDTASHDDNDNDKGSDTLYHGDGGDGDNSDGHSVSHFHTCPYAGYCDLSCGYCSTPTSIENEQLNKNMKADNKNDMLIADENVYGDSYLQPRDESTWTLTGTDKESYDKVYLTNPIRQINGTRQRFDMKTDGSFDSMLDIQADNDDLFRITISVKYGYLTLSRSISQLNFSKDYTGLKESYFIFISTLDNCNRALQGAIYTPKKHFNTNYGEPDSIQVKVEDLSTSTSTSTSDAHNNLDDKTEEGEVGSSSSSSSSISIMETLYVIVNGVNDIPKIKVPGQVFKASPLTSSSDEGEYELAYVKELIVDEDIPLIVSGIHIIDADCYGSYDQTHDYDYTFNFKDNDEQMKASSWSSSGHDGIQDTDCGIVNVLVYVKNGIITLGQQGHLPIGIYVLDGINGQSNVLRFMGDYKMINEALSHFVYTPNPNWFGYDSITIEVDDYGGRFNDEFGDYSNNIGNNGVGDYDVWHSIRSKGIQGGRDSQNIPISVLSVNDAPIWEITDEHKPLICQEDVFFNLGEHIKLIDYDYNDNTNSKILYQMAKERKDKSTSSSTSKLYSSYSEETKNNDIEYDMLEAELEVTIWTDEGTLLIETPGFSIPDTVRQADNEDSSSYGGGVGNSYKNDLNYNNENIEKESIKQKNNLYKGVGGLTILEGGKTVTSSSPKLKLRGSLKVLNRAIEYLNYIPPHHFTTVGSGHSDSVHFLANDLGSSGYGTTESLTATALLAIEVTSSENDAPIVTVPGAVYNEVPCESIDGQVSVTASSQPTSKQMKCKRIISVNRLYVDEDTPLHVSGISIHDPDAIETFGSVLEVTLASNHGYVTLPEHSYSEESQAQARSSSSFINDDYDPELFGQIKYVGGTSNKASLIKIQAPEIQLNQILSQVMWQGDVDWFGSAWLNVTVNDLGYSGFGGPKNDSQSIPIFVNPIADAPKLIIPMKDKLRDVLVTLEDTAIHVPCSLQNPDSDPLIDISRWSHGKDDERENDEWKLSPINLTETALALDPTFSIFFKMLDDGIAPSIVAERIYELGLDPSIELSGTPEFVNHNDGRFDILDSSYKLEDAIRKYDATSFYNNGIDMKTYQNHHDNKDVLGENIYRGDVNNNIENVTKRGKFYSKLNDDVARDLEMKGKGKAEVLLHLMRTFHNPNHPNTPGAGLIRLTLICKHGKVMLGSQIGLEFAIPNTTSEFIRRLNIPFDASFSNYHTNYQSQLYGASGANASYYFNEKGKFKHHGNIHQSSGLGGDTELGDDWTSHSRYDQDAVPKEPDEGASGSPSQLWWRQLQVTGRSEDIDRALEGLIYWPDLNWNSDIDYNHYFNDVNSNHKNGQFHRQSGDGSGYGGGGLESIHLLVENLGQVGSMDEVVEEEVLSDSANILIRVLPVNDAPVVTLPSVVYAKNYPTLISYQNNTNDSNNNDDKDIGEKKTSIYDINYHNGGKLITDDGLTYRIISIDRRYMNEDEEKEIGLNGVIRDVDMNENTLGLITVTIKARHGTLYLRKDTNQMYRNSKLDELYFIEGADNTKNSYASFSTSDSMSDFIPETFNVISFKSSLKAANDALQRLVFKADENYFGPRAQVRIHVSDNGYSGLAPENAVDALASYPSNIYGKDKEKGENNYVGVDSLIIPITVRPINDPPVLTFPYDHYATSGQGVGQTKYFVDEEKEIRIGGFKHLSNKGMYSAFTSQSALSPHDLMKMNYGHEISFAHVGSTGFELFRSGVTSPSKDTGSWGHTTSPQQSNTHGSNSEFSTSSTSEYSHHTEYNSHHHNYDADSNVNIPRDLALSVGWRQALVKDISPGSLSSKPSFLQVYNNELYFAAYDKVRGNELWRTDGTQAGTMVVKDLLPGSRSSNPKWLTEWNGELFFTADGIDTNWGLLFDHTDECNGFRTSHFAPDKVRYMVSDSNVWIPGRTYDCPAGYHWATTQEGYQLFPQHQPSDDGSAWKRRKAASEEKTYFDTCGWNGYIWGSVTRQKFRFSDSHLTGAFKHAGKRDSYRPDIETNGLTTNHFAGIVCIVGDSIDMPSSSSLTSSKEHHKQDGDSIDDDESLLINEGQSMISSTWDCRGSDGMNTYSHENWVDEKGYGDFQPTYLISNDYGAVNKDDTKTWADYVATSSSTSSSASSAKSLGGMNTRHCHARSGSELWKTNGTVYGTVRVDDLNSGIKGSDPSYLTVFKDSLFYSATTSKHGRELWRVSSSSSSDGIGQSSSRLIKDINIGYKSSNPKYLTVCGSTSSLFFTARDDKKGEELWVSDGMLGFLGEESSDGDNGYGYGGDYNNGDGDESSFNSFVGHHSSSGSGTYRVKDIHSGELSSSPQSLVCLSSSNHSTSSSSNNNTQGLLLFAADDGIHGYELWRSDGVEGNTQMVKDIYPGTYGSNPQYMTLFKDKVYFSADDGYHGSELWVTDGTSNGTIILRDIRSGSSPSFPAFFTIMRAWENDDLSTSTSTSAKELLYFVAIDGKNKAKSSVRENHFNHLSNKDHDDHDHNNFKYNRGEYRHGLQLWETDGTFEGTQRSYDQTMNDMNIDIETLNADWPRQLTSFKGSLYYPANVGTGTSQLPKGFHINGHGLYSTSSSLLNIQNNNDQSYDDDEINLNNYDNEEMVKGVDAAFEVFDVDTLSGHGEEGGVYPGSAFSLFNKEDDDESLSSTKTAISSALDKFGKGGYLKLKLSSSKGRLTFGHFLRLQNDKQNNYYDSRSRSTGPQGASHGYRTASGDIRYDQMHSSSYTLFNDLIFTIGDGINDDIIEIIGTSISINEALKDLRYKAKKNEYGWDEINIILSDSPLQGCHLFAESQSQTHSMNHINTSILYNQSSLISWIYETWYHDISDDVLTSTSTSTMNGDDDEYHDINNFNKDDVNNNTNPLSVFGDAYQMLCDHGEAYEIQGKIDVYITPINDAPTIILNRALLERTNQMSTLGKELYDNEDKDAVPDTINDNKDENEDQKENINKNNIWNVYVNKMNSLPLGTILFDDSDIQQSYRNHVFNGVTSEPMVTITIRCLHGILSLSSLEGITLLSSLDYPSNDGQHENEIQFIASIYDANLAIDGLSYSCDDSIHTCNLYSSSSSSRDDLVGDEITIHIDDNGNTGRGGPLSATEHILVYILPNLHNEDDDDITISYDEYYNDYQNSEDDFFHLDDDDDGSSLSVGSYKHSMPNIITNKNDENDKNDDSIVHPLGSLSWHDVHLDYKGEAEPQQNDRIGDADFWDD